MFLRVAASIKLVPRRIISSSDANGGLTHQYNCGVVRLTSLVMCSSSLLVYQFRFALALVVVSVPHFTVVSFLVLRCLL